MPTILRRPLLAALIALAAAPAWSAEKLTVRVDNASPRTVDCALVVEGKTRTYLKIRPGKAWWEPFHPRRTLQLVCDRTVGDGVWRLKPGSSYRLVDVGGKVDLVEGAE